MKKLNILLFLLVFPIFVFAQKTIFVGSGYTLDIDNIYTLDGENTDAFQFREKNSSFCLEGRINQKLHRKIGFITGLKIGRMANYWLINEFVVPELNGSYAEWWYSGYELAVPLYLNYNLDLKKMGNVKMEAGTTLGMRSLVTIKEHSHMDVTNPNLNLIGMLVSSNPAFYNRFSGAYSLGINWQLPKTRHFKLNNFIVRSIITKLSQENKNLILLEGKKM